MYRVVYYNKVLSIDRNKFVSRENLGMYIWLEKRLVNTSWHSKSSSSHSSKKLKWSTS